MITQNEFNFIQEACVDKINKMLINLVESNNAQKVAETPKKPTTPKKESK